MLEQGGFWRQNDAIVGGNGGGGGVKRYAIVRG